MAQYSCAFTGHRPQKFKWGYDEEHPDCVKLKLLIAQQILALVDNNVTTFISGMAQGVDQWAALAVLGIKQTFPQLRLVCVLPCEEQANRWSTQAREQYFNILAEADNTLYISRHYTKDCMLERNRFMVDHAHFLMAVYNGERRGGTGMTVNYAQKKGRAIITIDPNTLEVTPFTIVLSSGEQSDISAV